MLNEDEQTRSTNKLVKRKQTKSNVKTGYSAEGGAVDRGCSGLG